ncbi:substrate-binding domain-containing protein [Rhodobacter capsulatus]|uniref:substrate-binding domain-containing protein n=1 Tax=Rhodobacter capsulatus TaxID=1061 RepID=UPI0003D2FEFB|nr:PhnD/SsuA/transferrin family substrate-binding protein [Rhodobacter capsulatus]ETD87268.1 phosphonate ABC transporter substrate-binding protein [Rhodobacter capsulatus YW2]
MPRVTRRGLIGGAAAFCATQGRADATLRFALTPVILDNDADAAETLRAALAAGSGHAIELVRRRSYAEITALLLEGSVEAAWLCGYPYLQHRAELALLGVPVWRGRPRYQSYLIATAGDPARSLADLRGGIHAFSDPDSNSGWLVTASDLARIGETPDRFFARSFFTWGHRNVVRAVAAGLARSGSVDGYVWEALRQVEPDLTEATRVVARSEWLGFPPLVARRDRMTSAPVQSLQRSALQMAKTAPGRAALGALQLDGIIPAEPALYDGILARMHDLGQP